MLTAVKLSFVFATLTGSCNRDSVTRKFVSMKNVTTNISKAAENLLFETSVDCDSDNNRRKFVFSP